MIASDRSINSLLNNSTILSDDELLARISESLPANTLTFCVNQSFEHMQTALNRAAPVSWTLRLDDSANAVYASALDMAQSQLYKLSVQDIETLFDCPKPLAVWLVPFKSDSKAKWLLIVDSLFEVSDEQIEKHFYLINWMFAQRDLLAAKQELTAANNWINEELKDISRLQHLMLPDKSLSIPGASIAYTYRAMAGAGGDYLDVMDLSKDRLEGAHDIGAIVADVTGHGPSAAVEAAMLDAILRTFKPTSDSDGPSQVLEYINQHFFTRKARGSFLTANIFRYLGESKLLTYGNAGHPHAYIKRGRNILPLKEGGIPVGVLRDNQWQSYTFNVETNDILFIYSDVIIETKNVHGDEFGFERLEQALINAPCQPDALLEMIEGNVKTFCQCQSLQDDLTLCAIQFK